MKELVCVFDNVYFNKQIYNEGDIVNMDDELAKTIRPGTFVPLKEWEKGKKAILYKIQSAKATNQSLEDMVLKAEKEKQDLIVAYEEKIKALEDKINEQNIVKEEPKKK